MRYGFGVDLGGTTVKIAYFSEQGELLTKWEIPTRTEQSGSLILPDIAASVLEFMKKENISDALNNIDFDNRTELTEIIQFGFGFYKKRNLFFIIK